MKLIKRRIWSCVAVGTAMLAGQVYAQESNATTTSSFKEFFSGTRLPLTLKLKNLDDTYKRITIQGQADSFNTYLQMIGGMQGIELGTYYTKGDTVQIGDETYLIAYHSQDPLDPNVMRNFGHGDPTPPRKPSPNSTLALSLLNLRTAGSINDVRTFDPKRDMETEEEANQVSLKTLGILGHGFITYVRNRGENVFPKSSNVVSAAFRRQAYPFVHDERTWKHPGTEEPYRYNQKLSGVNFYRITNPQYVILFYEPKAGSDGKHGVVFVDEHTERVDGARLARLQATNVKLRPATGRAANQRRNRAVPAAPGTPPPPPPPAP